MFFPFKASISRLSQNPSDGDKESYVVIANPVFMDIQPAGAELIAISEGRLGNTFKAFTTYSGVVCGDRITVSGTNNSYKVKAVDDWNYGPMPHMELVLFQGDE